MSNIVEPALGSSFVDLRETIADFHQEVYTMKSLEWLSLQVRITIEVPSPDALSNVIFEDQEERHVKDAGYQAPHLLNLIMWSSNLWIARRRDLLEGSVFCPLGIMTVKFCSSDLERITSRKISCTRNPHILPTSSFSTKIFVDSGLDPSQLKSKPSPSSQVLDTSVYALDLRERILQQSGHHLQSGTGTRQEHLSVITTSRIIFTHART
nr:hypothetical protein Iba_chr04bCG18930 [Ipomoea batatas]